MNTEKYIALVEEHRKIFEKARNLIELILDRVQQNVERVGNDQTSLKKSEDYVTEVNIVNKLSVTLLKIAKYEQEIAQIDFDKLSDKELDEEIIEEVDFEIVEDWLRRHKPDSEVLNMSSP